MAFVMLNTRAATGRNIGGVYVEPKTVAGRAMIRIRFAEKVLSAMRWKEGDMILLRVDRERDLLWLSSGKMSGLRLRKMANTRFLHIQFKIPPASAQPDIAAFFRKIVAPSDWEYAATSRGDLYALAPGGDVNVLRQWAEGRKPNR